MLAKDRGDLAIQIIFFAFLWLGLGLGLGHVVTNSTWEAKLVDEPGVVAAIKSRVIATRAEEKAHSE